MTTSARPRPVTITIDEARRVSGLLQAPKNAHTCYLLARGAGAGMSHPFMAAVADGLAERDIATLRYQFPYMEQGSKRRDAAKLAQACQSASKFDPRSASNFDPLERRARTVTLAPSELVGVAETGRARVCV